MINIYLPCEISFLLQYFSLNSSAPFPYLGISRVLTYIIWSTLLPLKTGRFLFYSQWFQTTISLILFPLPSYLWLSVSIAASPSWLCRTCLLFLHRLYPAFIAGGHGLQGLVRAWYQHQRSGSQGQRRSQTCMETSWKCYMRRMTSLPWSGCCRPRLKKGILRSGGWYWRLWLRFISASWCLRQWVPSLLNANKARIL